MIFYRTLLDELRRDDQFCDCCGLRLRARFIKAATEGDRNFLFCQDCRTRWTPHADIDEAARGWVLVMVTGSEIPAAVLCIDCAREHPEPVDLPWSIMRFVLEHSRAGLLQ